MTTPALSPEAQALFDLLPVLYRLRDAQPDDTPGPLASLLEVVGRQVAVLREDLAQSYDDLFIETCAEWVVPYIGDLVGTRPLHDVGDGASSRADVANTIGYRRRKGTVAVVEQVARDLTGWPAKAVELFTLVAATQFLNHVRPERHGTVSLRDPLALERLGTAFDPFAHTADVRRVNSAHRRGLHNIPNIAVYLWRLQARSRTNSPAVAVDATRYRFSPLGHDVPLVTRPEPEPGMEHLADISNVPWPLSRRLLAADLAVPSPPGPLWYGPGRSIDVVIGDPDNPADHVPAGRVHVCDLRDYAGGWAHTPVPAGAIAIDPVLGRLALGDDPAGAPVLVTFHTEAAGRLGGGEYTRPGVVLDEVDVPVQVEEVGSEAGQHGTVAAAVAALAGGSGVVELAESGRWEEDVAVTIEPGGVVVLRAADGRAPCLVGDITVAGGTGSHVVVDGLLVSGALRVTGAPAAVVIAHATFVPGLALDPMGRATSVEAPSVVVEADGPGATELLLDHAVTGPLRLPAGPASLAVRDSIVDSPRRHAHAALSPALVGGAVPALALTSATPAVAVAMGDTRPVTATLARVPADMAEAATLLQAALRAASPGAAFAGARVVTGADALTVVPGVPVRVSFAAADGDPTAEELGLTPPAARAVTAVVGSPVRLPLQAAAPAVDVLAGSDPAATVALSGAPASAADAAAALQAAVQAVDPGAVVAVLDDRLVLLSDRPLALTEPPGDPTTTSDLGLDLQAPAISGDHFGAEPGPATTIERSTVAGAVFVRQLDLASDTVFTDPVLAERTDVGCVRFSFVPPPSRTPRRFRCVPDEGHAGTSGAGGQRGPVPEFTSLRFGQAAYGQLSDACPEAVRRGAHDESEMGAFHERHEPQREDNLAIRLDECLRLSREAGARHAT